MRILQAFDFLSLPHGGGAVDVIYKLSRALSAQGHDVTICAGDYGSDYAYLSGLGNVGLKLYHSYFNKHGVYLMPGLTSLDVRNYDVIHLHCYRSMQNVVLAQKAITSNIPYIIDAHGSTVHRTGRKKLLLDMFDMLFGLSLIEKAKLVIAETEVGFVEWEKLGADTSRIRLQHPLLDTSEFVTLPDRGSFRQVHGLDDTPIVLFLGRIHQAKGIDTLVDAVRLLHDRGTDTRLVIAGQDDGYRDSLSGMLEGTSIKVVFTGYLSGKDKLAALVDANLLVQPSIYEAGARPSLEAIMCNTPVIVSKDTGAGREIASFDGGLLFETGNAAELADRILEILHKPDEARIRTEKAKGYIEANLSLTNGIAGYEKIYEEAVV